MGFDYVFADKWIFSSKLGWLAVESNLGGDDILNGQIVNANAGGRWKAFRNVGVFAQYQLFNVDIDISERGDVYAIDYRGPLLGVAVNF